MPNKIITFAESVNEALIYSLKKDKNMICYGLGTTDPKNIFSTTKNLESLFGSDRIFDVPTSENALTGISIGAALNKVRSVVSHQRVDFALLAMDQIINSAAKWHYMFGSNSSVPITIRLIIGRGWGQGPTHSQSLQSLFVNIPGLKVVVPSNPQNCYDLLVASIFDPNPVIFIEHRWLHNISSKVIKKKKYNLNQNTLKILSKGKDLTIVSMSFATVESLHVVNKLKEEGIYCELIDINVLKPLKYEKIINSVKKTGRLLVIDTDTNICGFGSEIISVISQKIFKYLKKSPIKLAMPDVPVPTSYGLTKDFYYSKNEIIKKIKILIDCKKILLAESFFKKQKGFHDVPGTWFNGPF
jgi:pyruvate/2-oxoglutarate/acetoin dehydrogenase E1 component